MLIRIYNKKNQVLKINGLLELECIYITYGLNLLDWIVTKPFRCKNYFYVGNLSLLKAIVLPDHHRAAPFDGWAGSVDIWWRGHWLPFPHSGSSWYSVCCTSHISPRKRCRVAPRFGLPPPPTIDEGRPHSDSSGAWCGPFLTGWLSPRVCMLGAALACYVVASSSFLWLLWTRKNPSMLATSLCLSQCICWYSIFLNIKIEISIWNINFKLVKSLYKLSTIGFLFVSLGPFPMNSSVVTNTCCCVITRTYTSQKIGRIR